MNSSNDDHLSQDLIFRALDDELSVTERLECESHLAVCETCSRKLSSLREFSSHIESAVQSMPVSPAADGRQKLQRMIVSTLSSPAVVLQHPSKVMRRFGWGMGLAATLALGVLFAPRHDAVSPSGLEPVRNMVATTPPTPIEVEGETFQPVPYSNADLSASAPHIVQMQVPISSLADVGIVMEPVNNRYGSGQDSDGSVLADVLVGADGQPRGVHVLEYE